MVSSTYDIILFDGVCNLCDASVNFIIRHDANNCFKFAALQSDAGKKIMQQYKINPDLTNSIVLLSNDKIYIKSGAVLRIAKKLNRLYPLLFTFIVIPPFFRDFVYDFIAKNRYKWFGKKEQCMLPSAEIKAKFLH